MLVGLPQKKDETLEVQEKEGEIEVRILHLEEGVGSVVPKKMGTLH